METKKTAIQIAIESYQNDGVSFTDWFMDNSSMLLAMEKKQIKKSFNDGYKSKNPWHTAEHYYNETYGTK